MSPNAYSALYSSPENKAVGVMKVGHTFTIEPMINEGNQADLIRPCHLLAGLWVTGNGCLWCRNVERCHLAG